MSGITPFPLIPVLPFFAGITLPFGPYPIGNCRLNFSGVDRPCKLDFVSFGGTSGTCGLGVGNFVGTVGNCGLDFGSFGGTGGTCGFAVGSFGGTVGNCGLDLSRMER